MTWCVSSLFLFITVEVVPITLFQYLLGLRAVRLSVSLLRFVACLMPLYAYYCIAYLRSPYIPRRRTTQYMHASCTSISPRDGLM
jgi:hypothetical protein